MTAIRTIQLLAATYGAATDLAPRQVSWRVFGDTNILDRLEKGGDLTTRRFESALEWFSANWPAGAAWPSVITRPEHAPDPSLSREENAASAASCPVPGAPIAAQEAAR